MSTRPNECPSCGKDLPDCDCQKVPMVDVDSKGLSVKLASINRFVEGVNRKFRKRPDWDEYFMGIAREVSSRATCDRKHVGAVIVKDRNIVATGYNGSIPGQVHCDEGGHLMEEGHCVRTVHAEANAIVQAAKHGNAILGATIYTTASPCFWCFKLIASAGISRIVFGEMYRDERITQFAKEAGIRLTNLSKSKGA